MLDQNTGGFLPPVYETNQGNAGRTYPVKWQLMDNTGAFISELSAVTKIEASPSSICTASGVAAFIAERWKADNTWRYDFDDNQFIYNWKTPGVPGCYQLDVFLASGQMISATFFLK